MPINSSQIALLHKKIKANESIDDVLAEIDPDDLLAQIKKAVHGKMVLSDAVNAALADAIRRPVEKPVTDISNLTNRELEILELIAKGLSNKLIARELDISDGTVKVHVKHLLKKLNLRSRVEAAVWMVSFQGKPA